MIAGTGAVRMDEPSFGLKELNELAPDGKSWRRYQCIKVIRNDRLAEFRRDLGLASTFTVGQFCVPGGVMDESTGRFWLEHTVGELVDIADLLRSDQYDRPETPQPSDLIGQYHESVEKKRLAQRKRSMVGPLVRVQRD